MGRYLHTANLLPNGKVLIAGGYNATIGGGGGWLASAEVYDPAKGIWEAPVTFNARRGNHIATLLANRKVLIAGGIGSGVLSSAELYEASAETNLCTPSPSDLIAWWPGEGNAKDEAGTNHGTLMNGATYFTIGRVRQAFSFDGVDDYMSAPPTALSNIVNNFTMEFWVYPTAGHALTTEANSGVSGTSSQRYAIFPYFSTAFDTGAGVSVGTNGISVFEHGSYYLPSPLVYQGGITGWTHVAVVYTNKQPSLYVNGAWVRTGLMSVRTSVHPSPGLGGYNSYGYFAGLLDEVSIYNRALNASEIASIYAAGGAGKCLPSLAPSITDWSGNQTVLAGINVSFVVTATGSTPLAYQWSKDGAALSDGGKIAGAQQLALTLSNVLGGDAGGYSVIITNAYGSVTSSIVTLAVLDPIVSLQPTPLIRSAGQTAVLQANAIGTLPLNYQWLKDGLVLEASDRVSGDQSPTLTLSNLIFSDTGGYSLAVTNPFGTATSQVAPLTVFAHPVNGIYVVTSTNDDFISQPGTLRQAIEYASIAGGGIIAFSNVTGTILLRAALPTITNDISILGPGANLLSISGQKIRSEPPVPTLFTFPMLTVSTGAACRITGLTFKDGYYQGIAQAANLGGGALLNLGGTMFLGECVITNNLFPGHPVACGGGICSIGGNLSLSNCLVSGNAAWGGYWGSYAPSLDGGLALGGAIYSQGGSLVLTDCIVTNNLVLGGLSFGTNKESWSVYGGGVCTVGGLLTCRDTTFSGNRAIGSMGGWQNTPIKAGGNAYGAAVCNLGGLLWVTNCLITMNSVTGGVGGYYSIGGFRYGGDGGSGFGGALYERAGTNLVFGSALTGNWAQGGDGGGKPNPMNWTYFGQDGKGCGGAAAGDGGLVLISDCRLAGNNALGLLDGLGGGALGGGVYQDSGVLAMDSSHLSSNTAIGAYGFGYSYNYPEPGFGGAVFNNATACFTNCSFSGNASRGGSIWFGYTTAKAGSGGAIYNSGSIHAIACDFYNNNASGGDGKVDRDHDYYVSPSGNGMGGAVYNDNHLVLFDCLFAGNSARGGEGNRSSWPAQAAGLGGGVFNAGSCLITNSTFLGNKGIGGRGIPSSGIPGEVHNGRAGEGEGGGVFNSGTLALVNATFSGNSATGGNDLWTGGAGRGGALYNGTNSLQANHCTIAGNSATGGTGQPGTIPTSNGGGICNGGTAWLKNSILADSSSGSNYFGAVIDAGYNLSSDASCPLTDPTSRINTDPLLGPLTDNGGPTPTMALLPRSPAIDRGVADGVLTDQRGQPRPWDILGISNAGEGSDIGAFEYISDEPVLVTAWGDNASGQAYVGVDVTQIKAIAAGVYHSLALKTDGTVVGWGENDFGQSDPPAGLTNIIALAAGWGTSLALKQDGTLTEWGWDGGYGLKSTAESLTNVSAIAATWDCLLALDRAGSVIVWGKSTHGETNLPFGLTGVTAIAGGGFHCLALRSDGTVATWGDNSEGQLNVPDGLTGVVAIAAGGYHSLALRQDGTVVAWGMNFAGQTNVPPDLAHVVAISAGAFHSLALKSGGSAVAWGDNARGQTNVPAGPTNVLAIAAGGYHNLALTGSRAPWTMCRYLRCTASGPVQFTVSGLCGDVYQIMGSTNLLDWQSIATVTNFSGWVDFIDPAATNHPQRFYRVRMP